MSDEAFIMKMKLRKLMVKNLLFQQNQLLNGLMRILFFRLSKWEKPLLEFYNKNPNFISPESRKMKL